jgi:hypothetical protein
VVALALVVLFGVGLDLWTDALWYASVGFDSVFWTRLTATLGLFVGASVLAAVVLLGNLWLARRLAPPPGTGGPSTLRGLFERLNEPRRRPTPNRPAWIGVRRAPRCVRDGVRDGHLRCRRAA